ncbi:MAG: hypothetical protein PSV16_04955 [Flavobacterium sp.]|nr:hypothetical protein [Flavobacterium sp.]
MTKKILLAVIVLTIIVGCYSKFGEKMSELANDYKHSDILESSTEIVIESEIDPNSTSETSNLEKKKYLAETEVEITAFKKLFTNSKKTDYCCCPKENYSVSFYYLRNNFDYYLVDTTEFKDNVRIYETSYQYSYIVSKALWKSYLKQLEVEK